MSTNNNNNNTKNEYLANSFDIALQIAAALHTSSGDEEVAGELESCSFIQAALRDLPNLDGELLDAFISQYTALGHSGEKILRGYVQKLDETKQERIYLRIAQLSARRAYSCQEIKTLCKCGGDCKVEAPWRKWLERKSASNHNSFRISESGLYYSPDSGMPDDALWLSGPISVIAKTHDTGEARWGRLIEFITSRGELVREIVPMSELLGQNDLLIGKLASLGLEINPDLKAKKLLVQYLHTVSPRKFIKIVRKIGWHGCVYVLPDKQYGESDDDALFYQAPLPHKYCIRGTFEDWKAQVAGPSINSPLLMLSLSYALTGPMLEPMGMSGGGIHIYGNSSTGKTTALFVAGSVCGGDEAKGFYRTWRATDNGLEGIAFGHNDNLLCLDEIGQANPRVVSACAYMLADGQGKTRANKLGDAREAFSWRLSFLSSGEVTLDDCIQDEKGRYAEAGQLVRIIDLPADAGQGYGIFTSLGGYSDGSELSTQLVQASQTHYGHALRAFLNAITKDREQCMCEVESAMKRFMLLVDSKSSGQVMRVAKRFALTAACGELAIRLGIFPWPIDSAHAAAQRYFEIWLEQRGGVGNREVEKAINDIKIYIEKHGDSMFADIDDHSGSKRDWRDVGWRWKRNNQWCYMFPLATFEELFCRKVRKGHLSNELAKRGYLVLNSNNKPMETKSIGGHNHRGIVLRPSAWESKDNLLVDESHKAQHAPTNKAVDNADVINDFFDDMFSE